MFTCVPFAVPTQFVNWLLYFSAHSGRLQKCFYSVFYAQSVFKSRLCIMSKCIKLHVVLINSLYFVKLARFNCFSRSVLRAQFFRCWVIFLPGRSVVATICEGQNPPSLMWCAYSVPKCFRWAVHWIVFAKLLNKGDVYCASCWNVLSLCGVDINYRACS